MSDIRYEFANSTYSKAFVLIDLCATHTMKEIIMFMSKKINENEELTSAEKEYLLERTQRDADGYCVLSQTGSKRQCEYCINWSYAINYCEHCVRKYLTDNFSNWTSGNDEINAIIQECQESMVIPSRIVEWIPFGNLKNIEYKTRGGYASIFKARWKDGRFDKWNYEKQKLERRGSMDVILKQLDNSRNLKSKWFQETKTHLKCVTKANLNVVKCYGLTRDPTTGDYMLVLGHMNWVRPKIKKKTPEWYTSLMKGCWDANPENRPTSEEIFREVSERLRSIYRNELEVDFMTISDKASISGSEYTNKSRTDLTSDHSSKLYSFQNLLEPKNVNEGN
ncbi:10792_t:CDS:2 [Acaulospora colombiana]|uniref:10792_t:CDS:1 n=1 Tax=Acaulospora colombiana TaxID=27376 RepID=A0ACA9JZK2_9GLOM|nr:10792_t:CDS:2 [Acaulospora colombiana]